jgi:hypothetical protein
MSRNLLQFNSSHDSSASPDIIACPVLLVQPAD